MTHLESAAVSVAAAVSTRAWIARALAAATALYTGVLVFATHYPKPEEFLGSNAPSDKMLHVIAYGLLSFLAAAALAAKGGWTARRVAALAAGLAAFGVIDEITQPLFSRSAEPLDWVCDCVGIAAGLLIVAATVAGLRASRSARGAA